MSWDVVGTVLSAKHRCPRRCQTAVNDANLRSHMRFGVEASGTAMYYQPTSRFQTFTFVNNPLTPALTRASHVSQACPDRGGQPVESRRALVPRDPLSGSAAAP